MVAKLILGAAKDKGGWMSVRAHNVVVERPDLCAYIQKIFAVPADGAVGLPYDSAWEKTTSAIKTLMEADEIMQDAFSQDLLETLVKIRRSILEAEIAAEYREYGVECAA